MTDKICANMMKKTPTRALVASGCSIGSGFGRSADRIPSDAGDVITFKISMAVSLTVSLTMDPLSPTIDTPGTKKL